MKVICLDYDMSYTEFPDLFDMIIERAQADGHRVILATMRYDAESTPALEALSEKIEIFYTGRKAKLPYLKDLGIYPDLWIDDSPKWILEDSK